MRAFFVRLRSLRGALAALFTVLVVSVGGTAVFAAAQIDTGVKDGLLFSLSAGKGLVADFAQGDPSPNFNDKVAVVQDPKSGPYIRSEGEQVLAWHAASNIYAQRGTLSFRWRARDPLGAQPFPLFRVGYADHTSWDMVWLRIDWNGHGLDAFVTDDNLARTRVSYRMDAIPAPDQWVNIAFAWDETQGIRLYVDGKLVAQKDASAVLDSGLDQFGPFSRVISPYQVQSNYQFVRGGDIDEIRIFDHALASQSIAALAKGEAVSDAASAGDAAPVRDLNQAQWRDEWWVRYGWNRPGDPPVILSSPDTTIRKVEFTAAWDMKERMTAGNDGIAETTWPGVYNRSSLPGRHDYFELPDWNVYVEGGKSVTFDLPDEAWNHVEFQGAAYGKLSTIDKTGEKPLATRPEGQERTSYQFASLKGGKLRFDNVVQETPIQELQAYNVVPGDEPRGAQKLSYTVNAKADPGFYPSADALSAYISGRYVTDESTTVVALPDGAPQQARAAPPAHAMPIVHVIIPADFRNLRSGGPVGRFSYGWEDMDAGLDGIAIDIPALKVKPTHGAYFPLNIQIKDPIWPGRNLLDVNVSVKPGEARTVWLDTRDRLLPEDASLYLSIAGAGQDFDAAALNGAHIRLVFKPRAAALAEHIADRLAQIRDNVAFIVEEHTNDKRLARYDRLDREFASLFAADPDNRLGRLYWSELNPEQGWPAFTQPVAPKGVPLWAFRQVTDLKLVRQFIEWWIDNRQVPYGDFGGGISDDDDLTQQFPPLALMGDLPDKVRASLHALADAVDKNDMFTSGLSTIETDYLHSYEEGINARSEDMYLNWGDPKVVERLMQTARATPRITEVNKAGHTHITTQLFSGTHVVREGPWGWSHPYSYLILHPGILLVNFNDNPTIKKLVLDLADGYLAHGKQTADGRWDYPEFINSGSDETTGKLLPKTRGINALTQLFWTAYAWTGDKKYLLPLESVLGPAPHTPLGVLNANALDQLGKRDSWGKDILFYMEKHGDVAAGPVSTEVAPFFNTMRYITWQMSGDKKYLEDLYADEIQTASQRMVMVTEGHWWSDRVELFSDLLQRSRLGGMALRRNQMFPGHLVSWRFAQPIAAESVGILIHDPLPTKFAVEAYNLSAKPVAATMTGWMIAPGTWKMSGKGIKTRTFTFEQSTGVNLAFAPHKTTMVNFELVTPGPSTADRPDIGIGPDDVRLEGGKATVTVHSLGAVDAPAGTAVLVDAKGRTLASVAVPPIAAPLDLEPRTARVELPLKPGAVRVRIALEGGVKEITRLNNEAGVTSGHVAKPVKPAKKVRRSKHHRKMR
jgi:hypothetical protein